MVLVTWVRLLRRVNYVKGDYEVAVQTQSGAQVNQQSRNCQLGQAYLRQRVRRRRGDQRRRHKAGLLKSDGRKTLLHPTTSTGYGKTFTVTLY